MIKKEGKGREEVRISVNYLSTLRAHLSDGCCKDYAQAYKGFLYSKKQIV